MPNKSKTTKSKAAKIPMHPTRPAPEYGKEEMHLEYCVSMPAPWTHNIWVETTIHRGQSQQGDVVLSMPTWTPGSYKLREFAKNVSHFEAKGSDGKAITWDMDDKQTWRIKAGKRKSITIRYRLYCFEYSVRTPHCDDTHCFFQPSNALMYVQDALDTRCELIIEPFDDWDVACPLPMVKGKKHHYLAESYDILVDSPVEVGTHECYTFSVGGKRHEIAIYGFGNHDPAQMVKDFKTIVLQCKRMFGDLPYENYLFILHFTPKNGGGLEHLNSQVSGWDSFGLETRERYEDFLSLISHEFFHTWNVKRIRPEILGPFDYSKEQYTSELWVMEGVTVYYEWIQLIRAGVVSEERFLKALDVDMNRWEGRGGNSVMPLRQSSFLAWTKLYLADENFLNTGISYYLKGGLVALMLDFEIRERTKGKKSLDDVMRLAYQRHGWPKAGFPERGFEALVEEVAGGSWKAWFKRYLDSTAPLDLAKTFAKAGITLQRKTVEDTPANGKKVKRKHTPWMGWMLAEKDDVVTIRAVNDDGPAQNAGISAKDELLAIENVRVRSKGDVSKILDLCEAGDQISVHVYNGHFLRERQVTLGAEPAGDWQLVVNEKASAKAKAFRKNWLSN